MAFDHFIARRAEPPALQTRADMNPTLLVSWFCTILSLICILIRLLGRWVRTERLFREDKVMFYSIVPLLGRMAFVHVILLWGTNNTVTTGLTEVEIHHRMIGSKLVLPARIFYAAYIWTAKITVIEFLRRLIGQSWIRSYEIGLRIIYGFLGLTFAAVVVATLTECQPFHHYWQVIPDPGSQCRSAVAQLVTMGVCDMITDLVLILFPIPLVLTSAMRFKRKISLILLFLSSIGPLAITAYRIPSTIARGESQQFRSLLASIEILAATGVANAIVIGSFVRDRGVKKAKFRALSMDGSMLERQRTRSRSIAQHHWGSDESLVRELGLAVDPKLRHASVTDKTPRPAVPALPAMPAVLVVAESPDAIEHTRRRSTMITEWSFPDAGQQHRRSSAASASSSSTDLKLRDLTHLRDGSISPGARKSLPRSGFFVDAEAVDDRPSMAAPNVLEAQAVEQPRQSGTSLFLSDVGGLLAPPDPPQQSLRGQGDVIRETARDTEPRAARHGESLTQFLRNASPFRRGNSAERTTPRPSRVPTPSLLAVPLAPDADPDDLNISDAGGLLK